MNIWQSYKQEYDWCLVHFVSLATTLLKDEFTNIEYDEKQLLLTAVTPILTLFGLAN